MTKCIKKLKIILTLLVVFGHCTRMYTLDASIQMNTPSIFFEWLTKFIYSFHMPLFVILSGYIYQKCRNSNKYSDKYLFFLNKFKRLILPYLFVGIFFLMPTMIILKLSSKTPIEYVLKDILFMKDNRHLWFLPMLFMIFIIFRSIEIYLEKIDFRINIFFLVIFNIWANRITSILILSNILIYSIYFYLGMKLYQHRNNNFFQNPTLLKIFCSLSLNIFIIFYLNTFLYHTTLNLIIGKSLKILGALFAIYSVYGFTKFHSIFKADNFIIESISKNSFEIYLFHVTYVYLGFFYFKNSSIPPIILIISIGIISIIMSIATITILKTLTHNFFENYSNFDIIKRPK